MWAGRGVAARPTPRRVNPLAIQIHKRRAITDRDGTEPPTTTFRPSVGRPEPAARHAIRHTTGAAATGRAGGRARPTWTPKLRPGGEGQPLTGPAERKDPDHAPPNRTAAGRRRASGGVPRDATTGTNQQTQNAAQPTARPSAAM